VAKTSIEWTESTWNPLTGCTKLSAGCRHCYAERMALRLQAMGQPAYASGFDLTLHPGKLSQPLQWRKPSAIFVNSMSDLSTRMCRQSSYCRLSRQCAGRRGIGSKC
jgi:protein gp37